VDLPGRRWPPSWPEAANACSSSRGRRGFAIELGGELLLPWGSREAKRLGLYDELVATCALEAKFFSYFAGGEFVRVRDLEATTPEGSCCLTLPHPAMQEGPDCWIIARCKERVAYILDVNVDGSVTPLQFL
jgi:hypothetical protein